MAALALTSVRRPGTVSFMAKQAKEPPVEIIARALVRRSRSATLATALTGKREGWPYASLVTVAFTMDGAPILLMSKLADHTRNLMEDARASLLFEEASHLPNPQTGPRVTLTGRLKTTRDKNLAARFLARHPGAALYADFADFDFYKMTVERAHFVGGFGRANWIAAKKFLLDKEMIRVFESSEPHMIERLTGEKAEILAQNFGKGWKIVALDPEGFDLVRGKSFKRFEFDKPVNS